MKLQLAEVSKQQKGVIAMKNDTMATSWGVYLILLVAINRFLIGIPSIILVPLLIIGIILSIKTLI